MPTLPQILHTPHCRAQWRGLLLALVLVVSFAALSPASHAPTLGASDKLDHLLAFGALGLAAALSLQAGRSRSTAAGAGLLVYGALIEILQTLVPGRHADAMDLAVDAAGIAAGITLAWLLRQRWPVPAGRQAA
ncbi:MAG: VanZ family protein [Rubrivivax sp.]|nr:VanZ family protein [Rubrivivax sp.]